MTHGRRKDVLSEQSHLSWLDSVFVFKAFSALCYFDAFKRVVLQKHTSDSLTTLKKNIDLRKSLAQIAAQNWVA